MSCRLTKSTITKINEKSHNKTKKCGNNMKIAKKLTARSKLRKNMQEISYRYYHQY